MMPKCHRWHTITELRWCRKRHRRHSITKPRCCQNVTGHRNTRFQTLSNPTRVTEFSPVKVELVKMRTILELREGRSWRDPESTFWNFCCSSSSTVDPSVSVATPLTDALSGVSDILAMRPHTHTHTLLHGERKVKLSFGARKCEWTLSLTTRPEAESGWFDSVDKRQSCSLRGRRFLMSQCNFTLNKTQLC